MKRAGFGALLLLLLIFYRRAVRHTERYSTITGKGYRPRIISIGKWRYPAFFVFLVYFFIAVLLAFGVLPVMGAYYLQAGTVSWRVALASLPISFAVVLVLLFSLIPPLLIEEPKPEDFKDESADARKTSFKGMLLAIQPLWGFLVYDIYAMTLRLAHIEVDHYYAEFACLAATVLLVAQTGSLLIPVVIMILGIVGVPAEGIGMILGVDRLLDMARTTLNVTGDLAAAVVVSYGEEPPEALPHAPVGTSSQE